MRKNAAVLIWVAMFIVFSLAGQAIAGPVEDATEAYDKGDYQTAYTLFKPLAEKGLPEAQYHLGLMFDDGHGVSQDYAEAMKWFRKAAEQGNAFAQHGLGNMYLEGIVVPQDTFEATKWFMRAADQGLAASQYNVGLHYRSHREYVLAYMWLTLAISRLDQANTTRMSAQRWRDDIAFKMTPAQIAKAEQLAREWKPKKE